MHHQSRVTSHVLLLKTLRRPPEVSPLPLPPSFKLIKSDWVGFPHLRQRGVKTTSVVVNVRINAG